MEIRGWIYVILTNASPDVVWVGCSTMNPRQQLGKLNNVGDGPIYRLAYCLLVADLLCIEDRLSFALAHARVGNERYRCSVGQAVSVVRQVAAAYGLTETQDQDALHTLDPGLDEEVAATIKRLRQEIDALIDQGFNSP